MCTGKRVCDRTGVEHGAWTPKVHQGQILEYVTGKEAEYPRGLGDAVWRALLARRSTRASEGTVRATIPFTEVFAGPRAVLSARVARHLAVGQTSLRASSTSSC